MEQEFANISKPIFVERISSDKKQNACKVHYHKHYEIYYLLSGNRTYLIGDQILKIYANGIVLIPPGLPHQTFGEEFERILINFNRESLCKIFSDNFVDGLLKAFDNYYIPPQQTNGRNLFDSILQNYQRGNERMTTLQLAELLACFNDYFSSEDKKRVLPPSSNSPLLDNIINYVNDNYNTINTIEEIANRFYISKYYFCHLFSKEIGLPPVAYLTNVKISRACDYLRTTNMSITEISTRCGFNSSSYFFRIFKKNIRLSPLQYRKTYSVMK